MAARHPRMFHVCAPEAVEGIRRHGLLPTSELLTLFEAADRERIEAQRRPASVVLTHPVHGQAVITDNAPITAALDACLDGGMTRADWLRTLNRRVFFWADEASVTGLLGARLNRGRARAVLVLDTRRLAQRYGDRMELSAINSGSTIRRPARRGPYTFTPLADHSYEVWRRLRGRVDRVREITVVGGVRLADGDLLDVRQVRP